MHGHLFLVVFVALVYGGAVIRGLPGGLVEADVNDETVQEMANLAVSEMGSEYTIVNINKAEKQLVAGTLYIFDLNLQKTNSQGDTKHLVCEVKAVDAPWSGLNGLSEFDCSTDSD